MLLLYPVTFLSQGLHIRKILFSTQKFFCQKKKQTKQKQKQEQESVNTSHNIWIHFLLNFGTVFLFQ